LSRSWLKITMYCRAEREKLKHSALARNAGWMFAGQGMSNFFQVLNFILLARLLGSMQYGIFAGAFAFTNIVAQYSGLGSGLVLLRHVSIDRTRFSAFWANVLLVSLSVGSLLTILLGLFSHRVLPTQSVGIVLLAAVANCIFAQLTNETARVFQVFGMMKITALINLLTNLLRTAVAALMLLLLHRATAWNWALVAVGVSALAAVIAFFMVCTRIGWPHRKAGLFRDHLLEGAGFSLGVSATSVYNDIDKVMLAHYGLHAANGIYSMAYRVIDNATVPIYSVRDAAMPRYFEAGKQSLAQAAALGRKLMRKTLPLALLAALVIYLVAPFIPVLLGRDFSQSVTAMRWLCLIPLFRCIHQMSGCALTGAGLQRVRTSAQFAAAGCNLLLNLWLIPRYGWLGAAWASLITDGALGVANGLIVELLIQREAHRLHTR